MTRLRSIFGPMGVFRTRPVLAAVVTAVSLVLLGTVVVAATPLRCGPAGAFGFKNVYGCPDTMVAANANKIAPLPTPEPFGSPSASGYSPKESPASGPASGYPDGNPASGAIPPQGNGASPSGPYPPFYPPTSNGSPVSPLAIDCRLPVYAGPPGSGGFVVFPGSSFIADPGSGVALPTPSPGSTALPQGGPGYGQGGGLTYDRTVKKWVPVPTNWVSPDGNHYAYVSDGLYAVNAADGTQTELREGRTWNIVGVQNAGVYAGDQNVGGLWLFPYSGAPRQVTTTGYWQAANATAAYGTSTSAVPQGASNIVQRLDLATGKISDWFGPADKQTSVMGFDQHGNPILNVRFLNNSGTEIWIVSTANGGDAIAGFQSSYISLGFNSYNTPVADSHGVWFAGSYASPYTGVSATGLALYVPGSGFYWMSGIQGQLAGGCS
jgi:hypothetical protein